MVNDDDDDDDDNDLLINEAVAFGVVLSSYTGA